MTRAARRRELGMRGILGGIKEGGSCARSNWSREFGCTGGKKRSDFLGKGVCVCYISTSFFLFRHAH